MTNLHLPQNHYKIEMAVLAYLGVLRFAGEKAVSDCDNIRVIGGMGRVICDGEGEIVTLSETRSGEAGHAGRKKANKKATLFGRL